MYFFYIKLGWHRRNNAKAGGASLPFCVLVPLFHQEAEHAQLQAKLLSSRKLRKYQRTTYKKLQRIFKLWERYEETDMSTSSFLREAGQLYSPVFYED